MDLAAKQWQKHTPPTPQKFHYSLILFVRVRVIVRPGISEPQSFYGGLSQLVGHSEQNLAAGSS